MPGGTEGSHYETRTFEERLTVLDADGFQMTRDAELRLARVRHEMGDEAGRVVLGEVKRRASGYVIRESDIAQALFHVVLEVLA